MSQLHRYENPSSEDRCYQSHLSRVMQRTKGARFEVRGQIVVEGEHFGVTRNSKYEVCQVKRDFSGCSAKALLCCQPCCVFDPNMVWPGCRQNDLLCRAVPGEEFEASCPLENLSVSVAIGWIALQWKSFGAMCFTTLLDWNL